MGIEVSPLFNFTLAKRGAYFDSKRTKNKADAIAPARLAAFLQFQTLFDRLLCNQSQIQ